MRPPVDVILKSVAALNTLDGDEFCYKTLYQYNRSYLFKFNL